MTTTLKQLTLITTKCHADPIEELLIGAGALAISMQEDKKQDLFQLQPDESILWETIKITAIFNPDNFNTEIITIIEQTLDLPQKILFNINDVPDKNWVLESQKNFPAQTYNNKLWLGPSWETPPSNNTNLAIVYLNPGVAFGTGTHPTTQLCLQWLAENPPINKTVIDYGCGSGVLALAAIALGADQVFATDHDEQALTATQQNASYNGDHFTDKLNIISPNEDIPTTAPIILANILANPLIELRPTLDKLMEKSGVLVLSGILSNETDKIISAYENNFSINSIIQQQEWVRITLTK
jgi:ribosomal protein L11 methyltransferase